MRWLIITIFSLFLTMIVLYAFTGIEQQEAREQVMIDMISDNETIESVERFDSWGIGADPTVIIITTDTSVYTGKFAVKHFLDENTDLIESSVAKRNINE